MGTLNTARLRILGAYSIRGSVAYTIRNRFQHYTPYSSSSCIYRACGSSKSSTIQRSTPHFSRNTRSRANLHISKMFQAVTWEGRAKKLPQKPTTVLTRGAEFGIVQRPGTARFHRTAHRLNDAFQTLRAQVYLSISLHAACPPARLPLLSTLCERASTCNYH